MAHAAKNMDRSCCGAVAAAVAPVVVGAACCVAALVMVASGCSLPRTFPSASGDNGLSADSPPLPQVISSAVNYAHTQIAPTTPLIFNLPVEMNSSAWTAYERMLSPGKAMCPGDKGVWTVRQARIDGSNAQVDVEYPTRDGFYQMVTVHMKDASGGIGYKPEYLQYWRIPVKDPVCNSPPEVVERNCGAKAAASSAAKPSAATPAAAKPAAAKPSAAPSGAKPGARPASAAPPATKYEDPNK